jgi:hypothetical protein
MFASSARDLLARVPLVGANSILGFPVSILVSARNSEKTMPLHRGRIIGYHAGRMMFDFTMLTREAKTMDCSIGSSVMDRLIGRSCYVLSYLFLWIARCSCTEADVVCLN